MLARLIPMAIGLWIAAVPLVAAAAADPDSDQASPIVLGETWRLEPGKWAGICNSIRLEDPSGWASNLTRDSICAAEGFINCGTAVGDRMKDFLAQPIRDLSTPDHLLFRITDYAIERNAGSDFLAWIEFELSLCEVSESTAPCPEQGSGNGDVIRGYLTYWNNGLEPSPRTAAWGALATSGTAGMAPPTTPDSVPTGIVRSLHGRGTLADCLKDHTASQAGTGLCVLESLLGCQTFVEPSRCQEAGWLRHSLPSIADADFLPDAIDRTDQNDLDVLFGPLRFQEPSPDDLRGGVTRLDYRISRFDSHYRNYPNLMRFEIEEHRCFADEPAIACDPERFVPDHPSTAYFVWFPPRAAGTFALTPVLPAWTYYTY